MTGSCITICGRVRGRPRQILCPFWGRGWRCQYYWQARCTCFASLIYTFACPVCSTLILVRLLPCFIYCIKFKIQQEIPLVHETLISSPAPTTYLYRVPIHVIFDGFVFGLDSTIGRRASVFPPAVDDVEASSCPPIHALYKADQREELHQKKKKKVAVQPHDVQQPPAAALLPAAAMCICTPSQEVCAYRQRPEKNLFVQTCGIHVEICTREARVITMRHMRPSSSHRGPSKFPPQRRAQHGKVYARDEPCIVTALSPRCTRAEAAIRTGADQAASSHSHRPPASSP